MWAGKPDHFKTAILIELAVVIIVLAGCFGREKLAYSFEGNREVWTAVQTEESLEYDSEYLELSSGVYCLKAQTELETGQNVYIDVKAEESAYGSLRDNGMVILSGKDQAQFLVYVSERIPKAYVHCSFTGADIDSLVRVELYQTKLGNRMLLFLLITIFSLLDFLIWFRKGIMEKRIAGKQQVVFWTLTAGVLTAFFPYLTGYMTFGADSIYHLSRIAFLKDTLQQGGLFPVRVQGTWLCGHGYAASLFEGDLFLYIPALLMLIGFSAMSAYKIFLFTTLTATAAVAYFCFKKCVEDEYAALFGSMVYLLTPYYLLSIYGRAAVGEYLAMTFYPPVCCGMYLLYTKEEASKEYGKYKWYVILGISALLQCGLSSAGMTAIIVALACLIFWKKTFRKQTLRQLLEAAGIVLAVNAWFWLPLLYMAGADGYAWEGMIQEGEKSKTFIAAFQQISSCWRGPATAMIGIAAAFLFKWFWEKETGLSRAALGIAAVVCVGTAVFQVNDIAVNSSAVFLYNAESMGTTGVGDGRYLLKGTAAEDFYYHRPAAEDGLIYSDYEKSGTNVRMLLENTTDEMHFMEIPLTGYKGYEIRQEKAGEGDSPYITAERGSHGDLRIAVPGAWRGTVQISYQGFALFHVAEAVSLVSLAVIFGVYFYRKRTNARRAE